MLGLVQKIVGSIALAVIISLSIALWAADRRADKWEAQSLKLSAELKRISTQKNEQKVRTERIIVEVEKEREGAERIAKRIEAAPLPGKCETPGEIMGADL
jgi:hypothetical protein